MLLGGLYFKPIQQQVAGGEMSQGGESPNPNSNPTGGNNNYPTLVPTPVRAPRPPLLATPPGYYGIYAYYNQNLFNVTIRIDI